MNLKYTLIILFIAFIFTRTLRAENDTLQRFPAQISFVYPLGTSGVESANYEFNFSLNVIMGVTGVIRGVECAGIMNMTSGYFTGFQGAGIINMTNKKFKGVQAAGITNIVNDDFIGVQAAGIANIVNGNSNGVQAAGIANIGTHFFVVGQNIIRLNKPLPIGTYILTIKNETEQISKNFIVE